MMRGQPLSTIAVATWLVLAAGCATGDAIDVSGASGDDGDDDDTGPAGSGGSSGSGGSGGDDRPSTSGPGSSGTMTTSPSSSGTGGADGEGGSVGDGGGTVTTAASTGTGAACAGAAECEDADPCTTDVCDGALGCVRTAVAPGQTGTVEGGGCGGGVCQVDGSCGWSLYQRAFQPGAAFTRSAISQLWSGANAPPPRGIVASERLYGADVLFVVADDGNTYTRVAGAWSAPTPTTTRFPELGVEPIDSLQAYKFYATDATEYLIVSTRSVPRHVYSYMADSAGAVTFSFGPYEPADVEGGPPQASADCEFQLAHQFAYADQASLWIDQWYGFQGNAWVFDNATLAWIAYGPLANSPLFGGAAGGPAPGTTRSLHIESGTLFFVAP